MRSGLAYHRLVGFGLNRPRDGRRTSEGGSVKGRDEVAKMRECWGRDCVAEGASVESKGVKRRAEIRQKSLNRRSPGEPKGITKDANNTEELVESKRNSRLRVRKGRSRREGGGGGDGRE